MPLEDDAFGPAELVDHEGPASVGLGSETVWIRELPVAASAIGVSAVLEAGELSEASSIPGELFAADFAIGVSATVEVAKVSEAA